MKSIASGDWFYYRVSTQQIQEWQEECQIFVESMRLSDRKVLTVMGILNAIVWRAAADYDVIAYKTNDIYTNQFGRLLKDGVSVFYALKPLSEYLKKQWPQAFHSQHTLERWRTLLSHAGLYEIEGDRPRGAKWGKDNGVPNQGVATPPQLMNLNIPKMLIWYHWLYGALQSRLEKEKLFNFMPSHGGMLMSSFYNLMFNGLADFRNNVITESPEIIVPEEDYICERSYVLWKWRKSMRIGKKMWKNLIARAGQVAQEIKTAVAVQEAIPY